MAKKKATGKKTTRKKAARTTRRRATTRAASGANAGQILDRKWFEPDPEEYDTPEARNDRLADLLRDVWNPLNITSLRRIEIGIQGWEASYREVR